MEHRNTPNPLRTLDSGTAAPPALEARVRRTLVARGLLQPRIAGLWRRVRAVAAAVAIFLAGYVAGDLRSGVAPAVRVEPVPDGLSRYALFLYEDATFDVTRPQAERVAEYREWAGGLAERGRLAVGEKLTAVGYMLDGRSESAVVTQRGVTADAGMLTGLFIIRAGSAAEALSIARSSPHLRYGGQVDVRPIEETGSTTGR